mgnify:CR=1 FL=1
MQNTPTNGFILRGNESLKKEVKMEKEKVIKKVKSTHPRKYPKEVVDKVLSLIREGKNLSDILSQVPCKKSAVRRYARKASLTIKK